MASAAEMYATIVGLFGNGSPFGAGSASESGASRASAGATPQQTASLKLEPGELCEELMEVKVEELMDVRASMMMMVQK